MILNILLVVLLAAFGCFIYWHLRKTIDSQQRNSQTLIHAISHEIRTPIARMNYRLAIMKNDIEHSEIKGMEADIQELDCLVEEILTYARLDPSGPPLRLEQQDVTMTIDNIVTECRSMTLSEGKTIELECSTCLTAVEPRLLKRAIQNLVINALRYGNGIIKIKTVDTGNKCLIEVHDNGPGIDIEQFNNILKPFHRLEESRSRETGGIGLGLPIVQRVTESHGGEFSLGKSPLGGALFTISLPKVRSK